MFDWIKRVFRPDTIVVRSNPSLGNDRLEQLLQERLMGESWPRGVIEDPGIYYSTSTAIHAAVRTLTHAVARPRLEGWSLAENGEYNRLAGDHPLQQLLRQPHEDFTLAGLLQEIEGSLLVHGSAFVIIESDLLYPERLRPVPTGRMRVIVRDDAIVGFIEEVNDSRERRAWRREDVLWFRRYNPDSYYAGFSSITPARVGVEMGDEALRFNRRFYLNSAMPSDAVIVGADDYESAERILDDWDQRVYEPMMSHRPVVLTGGLDMKRLGANQSDMEFVASLQWTVEEVSRALGVPKVFLADLQDATLSNIQSLESFLWRNTVVPELLMIAEEFQRGLLPRFGLPSGDYVIRFDLADIEALHESEIDKAKRLQILVDSGIITPEEARKDLEL